MAKKIKVAHIRKASECLKRCKIEHVLVRYVDKDGNENDAFLVVMNKHFISAKAAIIADGSTILKTKNVRHYEEIALHHEHYQPVFKCNCRGCGKTFESVDSNAKWCSKKCRSNYRKRSAS